MIPLHVMILFDKYVPVPIQMEYSMNNSKHYFRTKGENAESFVNKLAIKTFLTDWCYPNPSLPKRKELCDLLVVFDNVAIIWQIKDLKLDESGHYKDAEVERNLRQLAGARRQLFDLKTTIKLNNPRRSNELFDSSQITEIYLISVLLGQGEDYFPFVETIRNDTVHVFTRSFTEAILTELDTIADFIAYLRAKESLVKQDKRITIIGGEEQLLAFYILNSRSFSRFDTATHILLEDDIWHGLQDNTQYKAKKKQDEISYGWDGIINRAHEGSTKYEPIARELARPNRFKRRFLSKTFYDAHVIAHNDNKPNTFRRFGELDGVTYCFIFCNENESRANREAELHATCYVARGKYLENKLVIGIATEKHLNPICSYSFCLLEIPTWTDDNQSAMEEIQKKLGILVSPTITYVEENEYPGIPE